MILLCCTLRLRIEYELHFSYTYIGVSRTNGQVVTTSDFESDNQSSNLCWSIFFSWRFLSVAELSQVVHAASL